MDDNVDTSPVPKLRMGVTITVVFDKFKNNFSQI